MTSPHRCSSTTEPWGRLVARARLSVRNTPSQPPRTPEADEEGRKDRLVPIPRKTLLALDRYGRTARPVLLHDPKQRAFLLSRLGEAMLARLVRDYGAAGIPALHPTPSDRLAPPISNTRGKNSIEGRSDPLESGREMAKKRKVWPEWWEWELELRPYTYKRLKERGCTEIELRRMMEHATTYKAAKREGRWVIDTRFQGAPWKVVVEPTPEKQKLVVVTAYEVEKLK